MKVYDNGIYRDATPEELAEIESYAKPSILEQIQSIKDELAKYDYIGVKIAMGVATKEDYADEIAHTEELRKQIRQLESEIN